MDGNLLLLGQTADVRCLQELSDLGQVFNISITSEHMRISNSEEEDIASINDEVIEVDLPPNIAEYIEADETMDEEDITGDAVPEDTMAGDEATSIDAVSSVNVISNSANVVEEVPGTDSFEMTELNHGDASTVNNKWQVRYSCPKCGKEYRAIHIRHLASHMAKCNKHNDNETSNNNLSLIHI